MLNGYVDQINSILGSDYKLTSADYNRHFENQRLLPFPIIKDLKGREHAILAERLPVDSPIQIYTDTARYYPYGDSAAHLLGYVGSNFDEIDTEGCRATTSKLFLRRKNRKIRNRKGVRFQIAGQERRQDMGCRSGRLPV